MQLASCHGCTRSTPSQFTKLCHSKIIQLTDKYMQERKRLEGGLRQLSFQQEACILDTQRSLYIFINRVMIIFTNALYLYIVWGSGEVLLYQMSTTRHTSFLPSLSNCFKMSWRRLLKETGGGCSCREAYLVLRPRLIELVHFFLRLYGFPFFFTLLFRFTNFLFQKTDFIKSRDFAMKSIKNN